MGVTAPRNNLVEGAVLAADKAAGAAQAPSNGSPARVPSSELRPAPDRAPRSALVEAVGREVAAVQAPGQGNKAEVEGSKLVLVLNPRAQAEAGQRVVTKMAVALGQTALVGPIAVPEVAVGAEVTEALVAGEAKGAGAVEEAVGGVKAKILIGESLLQGV